MTELNKMKCNKEFEFQKFDIMIKIAWTCNWTIPTHKTLNCYSQEGFAALISFIFIFESLEQLLAVRKERNVCTYPRDCPDLYSMCGCNRTNEITPLDQNVTKAWCGAQGGSLVGEGCRFTPDVFFMSILLFMGTFILSAKLKSFRNKPFFPSKMRQIISDFGVTAAIICMSLLDYYLGLDTPKLSVPTGMCTDLLLFGIFFSTGNFSITFKLSKQFHNFQFSFLPGFISNSPIFQIKTWIFFSV